MKIAVRPVALVAILLAVPACSTVAGLQPEAGTPPVPTRTAGTADAGRPTSEDLLDATQTVAGEPLAWPVGAPAMVSARLVTIAPGQTTGWHRHGVPVFGYVLSGTLEVEYEGLGRRGLTRGDRLLEAQRVAHNATNLGDEPVRILAVFMGAEGRNTVTEAATPSMPAGLGGRRPADLVELVDVDPSIRPDLRYATANNFTGHVIYPVARALMQRPAALALARAGRRARERGYGLLVLDAYRPWSVTREFWDDFPMHRAYLADPLQGSRHNRGCAVDLTLFDLETGDEIAMPSGYDDFSEKAHPDYAGGDAGARASRDLLRRIMEAEGFTVYENEWWHFDYSGWQDYPVLDVPLEDAAASATSRR